MPRLSPMPEAQIQRSIVNAARSFGWLVYATYRSLNSEPGFPDLVMVKNGDVILAEIKATKGRLSTGKWNKANTRWLPGQDDWKAAFEECSGVEYYLWREADLDAAYERLGRDYGVMVTDGR